MRKKNLFKADKSSISEIVAFTAIVAKSEGELDLKKWAQL